MTTSKRPRRNHSAIFKAKVAVDAIRGDKTLAELIKVRDVHANQIVDWKNQLLDRAASVFDTESACASVIDLKELHAKIGQVDGLRGAEHASRVACDGLWQRPHKRSGNGLSPDARTVYAWG